MRKPGAPGARRSAGGRTTRGPGGPTPAILRVRPARRTVRLPGTVRSESAPRGARSAANRAARPSRPTAGTRRTRRATRGEARRTRQAGDTPSIETRTVRARRPAASRGAPGRTASRGAPARPASGRATTTAGVARRMTPATGTARANRTEVRRTGTRPAAVRRTATRRVATPATPAGPGRPVWRRRAPSRRHAAGRDRDRSADTPTGPATGDTARRGKSASGRAPGATARSRHRTAGVPAATSEGTADRQGTATSGRPADRRTVRDRVRSPARPGRTRRALRIPRAAARRGSRPIGHRPRASRRRAPARHRRPDRRAQGRQGPARSCRACPSA